MNYVYGDLDNLGMLVIASEANYCRSGIIREVCEVNKFANLRISLKLLL